MEDILKRLLDTEARAEAIIETAARERERLIDEALDNARRTEAQFEAGLSELRAPFLKDAAAQAEQAIAELARKYEERARNLRSLAVRHEEEAVASILTVLLDPER